MQSPDASNGHERSATGGGEGPPQPADQDAAQRREKARETSAGETGSEEDLVRRDGGHGLAPASGTGPAGASDAASVEPVSQGRSIPPDAGLLAGLLEVAAGGPDEEHAFPGRWTEAGGDSDADTPFVGGSYRLLEEIGSGGMATVYKAVQVSLGRTVAIKLLADELTKHGSYVARFLREAKLAGTLSHPNIVAVFDAGSSEGKYYFAMEFVDGESVQTILERERLLPEERALEIARQIASGLEYASKQGLIHRDVKPGNILMGAEGTAKLADLGLVRSIGRSAEMTPLTRIGLMLGTPDYISPEQARGDEDLDSRSDVYSLGATLFRMLTGRPLFGGKTKAHVVAKHLTKQAPLADDVNPDVSKGTSLIIRKALEKDRQDRYRSPGEMASDLQDVLEGRGPQIASSYYGVTGRAPRLMASLLKRLGRRRALLVGVPVAVAIVLALAYHLAPTDGPPEGRGLATEVVAVDGADEPKATGPVESRPEPEAVDGSSDKVEAEAARLAAEQERQAAAEAEREKRFGDLVRLGRELLGDGDVAGAMDILIQAKTIKETDEVAQLLDEAKRMRYLARADVAERDGRLQEAIRLCERALDAKNDLDLRGRVETLRRKLTLAKLLAEADELAENGTWHQAKKSYEDALDIAVGDETDTVRARLEPVESEVRYLDILDEADRALRDREWREALELARAAADMRPDRQKAKVVLEQARRGLGPEKKITNSIGMEFVLIPAGEFPMGGDNGGADEKPQHKVFLDAYYIGKYEVTNAQFEMLDPTRKRQRTEFSAADDMPVVAVPWREVVLFCRWLSEKEGIEYRLPTEAEWERAARGTDGRTYPWGNEPPGSGGLWRCNVAWGSEHGEWAADGHRYASPVGKYAKGASPYGVHDLAGNVWEWCADWYASDYYSKNETRNPTGPPSGRQRVLRGGSFAEQAQHARSANRAAHAPGLVEASVGFRCVRALDPIFRVDRKEEAPK